MDMRSRRIENRLFWASALIIVGRLGLFIPVCLSIFALVLGYPIKTEVLALTVPISIVFLLIAGHLIEAYLWLVSIIVQSIALGFLLVDVHILRFYIVRDPYFLLPQEFLLFASCAAGFSVCFFWLLRKRRHVSKPNEARIVLSATSGSFFRNDENSICSNSLSASRKFPDAATLN
jgi:hypothetical protein